MGGSSRIATLTPLVLAQRDAHEGVEEVEHEDADPMNPSGRPYALR